MYRNSLKALFFLLLPVCFSLIYGNSMAVEVKSVPDCSSKCVAPECFSAGGYQIHILNDPGDFPLVFENANEAGRFEDVCDKYPCTVFAYSFKACNRKKLRRRKRNVHVAQALSNPEVTCSNNPFSLLSYSDPSAVLMRPGEGIGQWYAGDDSIQVLKWPKMNGDGVFYYSSTSNVSAQEQPIALKCGSQNFFGTLLAPDCQEEASEDVPELQTTKKGYSLADGQTVLVTFTQLGEVEKVELCDAQGDDCQQLPLKPQEDIYACTPAEYYSNSDIMGTHSIVSGECPQGSEYTTLNNEPYCCQSVSATPEREPTVIKTGENSCTTLIIDGRASTFCW